MNPSLTYLMDEICAGVEIYYTGRTGGQYLKTGFILCDDYSELVSKLFLLTDDPSWTDKRPNGHFKNYHDVLGDVASAYGALGMQDLSRLKALQEDMKTRRDRRNDFFHSTHLLDLSVTQRLCVDAFCDLFDYGTLLFPEHWVGAVRGARNLETMVILLRLERAGFSDPAIQPKLAGILADWPRNMSKASHKGVHLAVYPEDLHLRLCVICGGQELRDKLRALLLSKPH